ncbi:hypothetical protein BBI11_03810 [Planococcus maritimus]|uniref:hypothetical protein n=1 Tax=Planococcus maritimus TaxID=192421 RepID=UPI00080F1A49|nr:hypothetical protein [Planococcus maritimus]ANU16230.1 hypothetical protein BBI11_03810 [Planococcus maritimus]
MLLNYTKLVFKSIILQINLFIGLAGVLAVYFSDTIYIPYWVFLILPFVALYYVGYSIYKNSSPSIMIIPPDEDDVEVRCESIMGFKIIMKSRITNFGARAGSLENIKVHYLGFNGIRDEFLLRNLKLSADDPVVLKKKPNATMALKPRDFQFDYPLMVAVDKNEYIFFYTEFRIGDYFGYDEENKKDVLKWLKTLDFELEYKYKDTRKTYVKKEKIIINTDNFYDLHEKAKERQKGFEEFLKNE